MAPVSDVVRVEASAKKAAQKATERAQALAHRIAEKEARGQQRKAERAERLQAKGNSASAREAQRAAHREAVLEARRLQSQAAKLYPMDDQELLAVRGHTSGEERPLQAAFVQIIRGPITGSYERQPSVPKPLEQALENHGVCYIIHENLIEAEDMRFG